MADGPFPVQWTGQQAVVTLPQHIDTSNANQIREQLLWIINRGAAVLIADLTGTVSCDYSGADALARAHHRAVANGSQLRLVVPADAVRRVLSLNGFDRLVAAYPDLGGAIAAGAERREPLGERTTPAAYGAARAEDLLGQTVDSIFNVGLILQAAIDLPPDLTEQRITEALQRLDGAVREIYDHVFAERGHGAEPGPAGPPSSRLLERSARAIDHATLLQRHVAQTARAVQSAAADTAALLERRADLVGHPSRIDHPTDIKRWRAIADQAAQMAERWKQ
jgi:stage II sporulation protein AA (anti-sigma F factor antagonist)